MTKVRVVRNWQAIYQEPNWYLKWLVAFADEGRLVSSLRQAFPHFFVPTPRDWRPPLGFIEAVNQHYFGFCELAEWRATGSWLQAVHHLHLPIAYHWRRQSQIPLQVVKQFEEEQFSSCGDMVTYWGKPYVVVHLVERQHCTYLPFTRVTESHLSRLTLVSTEHIDMRSVDKK